MRYYRDLDYFFFFEDFPHMGVPGAIAANTGGSVNIYINTLYSPAVQSRTVKHELRHLAKEHFSCDWLTLTEKELDADDVDGADCVFGPEFAWVEYIGEEIRPPEPPRRARLLPGRVYAAFRGPELPKGAVFAFEVPGEELEPVFHRGQRLCCDEGPLLPGDVGLFLYRGSTLCRQYHRDGMGFTYLLALNRKRRREDVLLRPGEKTVCLGRVMLSRPVPLPGQMQSLF